MGVRKVSAKEFENAFKDAQARLLNRMFVGYHSNFEDCECYLTPSDLGGFAITSTRELVNVFNCEKGWPLLTNEEVKKIIQSKAEWCTVIGYYEKETHARKDICEYYKNTLGFTQVCQTIEDVGDMANHKGLDYALQFIDNYGIPYQSFLINSKFNVNAWDSTYIANSYADGVRKVLSFLDAQKTFNQYNIEAILRKLEDYWKDMSAKEIADKINEIYPGVLDDIPHI